MKTKLYFLTILGLVPFLSMAQSIKSFSPPTENAGKKINVTITGQNTLFQQGTDVITMSNGSGTITPLQSTFVNDTIIQSVFAFNKDNQTGNYNLSIYKNASYTLNLNSCFNLTADPTIASINYITPVTAAQSDTIALTIKGVNTNFGSAGIPTTFWLMKGGLQINGINVVALDSVTIQAQFIFTYAHPVGTYDVYFNNKLDGTVIGTGAFTLNTGPATPSIVSCSPDTGTQGQLLTVSITGQNTNFQQGTDVISLTNGSIVKSPQQSTFVNPTLINSTFAFNAGDPTGYYTLAVQKYTSYTLYLNNAFYLSPTAATPSLTAISPSSANQGATITLTITGVNTHFGKAATTTAPILKYGSYQINPASTTIIDSLTLQCQFNLSTSYPTGIYNAQVNNTIDGLLVLPNAFTINTGPGSPTITSVSPNTASPGQTLTVSITGQNTNFQQGTDNVNLSQGSSVYVYPSSLAFNSGTLMTAVFSFPANQPKGFYNVNVTGDNPMTLANGFLIPQACAASYTILPDTTIPHHYYFINSATGYPPMDYVWSWGDGSDDSTAYPSHVYASAGSYSICLSITDSLGCTSTYCDTSYLQKKMNAIISVDVIPDPLATGVSEIETSVSIKIYPNPVQNRFFLETPTKASLEILNINSQVIRTIQTTGAITGIDVEDFLRGIYIIKVTTPNGIGMQKFIKQ